MFDIGFWEICLIGVVALMVVGPERLPGLIKSIGFWVGRFRQIASNVKSELRTEIDKAEQLKQLVEEQADIVQRHKILEEVEDEEQVPIKKRTAAAVKPVSIEKTSVNEGVENPVENNKEKDEGASDGGVTPGASQNGRT